MKRVLVVEDSVSIRQKIKDILTVNGYAVDEAIDGLDGLRKLEGTLYDCIITDINMPNMNGIELIKKVRSRDDNKLVPILVLTTESQSDMLRLGKNAGATGWLVKPFNEEKLIKTLNRIIE
ncbi:MAG: response regulator [Spirochaetia bacterium]